MMRTILTKTLSGALILSGLAVVVTGCSTPEAKFSTDRKEYLGGDTVHLNSESTGADAFEWTMNDKVIGSTPTLKYVLDPKAKGPVKFSLKASSGEKNSVATQTIMATTPLGTVSIWSTFAGVEVLQVSGQGEQPLGFTATGFTADPGCSTQGCITLAVAPGTYTIDGISTVTRSRRIVELADNDCLSVKLH